jgi:hypothetical protein
MIKMSKSILKDRRFLSIGVAVLIVLVAIVAAIYWGNKKPYEEISIREASLKAENFINNYLMPSGSRAIITSSSEEYDLYKMTINIGTESPVESYVTKDGLLFFPQAINMDDVGQNEVAGNNAAAPTPVNVPKSDKPEVELFVMSYCPFGTQMLKGILPVIETLGDNIDFELKFNDYAMHDKLEMDENLVQHCIQKEQPEQLSAYLTCFLEDGERASCLAANADQNKINACVTSVDQEFKVTENYNNKVDWRGNFPGFNVDKEDNTKYGVGGSPTLVINGATINSSRDSASLLKTICSAFNVAPEECSTQLNNQSPTPGFGFDYSVSATQASCL